MPSLQIYASQRFLRAYHRQANPVEQHAAEHTIHDFVRRYQADSSTVSRQYQRIQGVRHKVLEIKTGGTGRLPAHFSRHQLTLLDFGGKEVVPRLTDQIVRTGLHNRVAAPDQFWPDRSTGFFLSQPGAPGQPYGKELHPGWLYFLDEEQEAVLQQIEGNLEVLLALLEGKSSPVFFVIGGPGTGKTSILLNLLKYFAEQRYDVGISLSENLARYVEASTNIDIERYRTLVWATEPLEVLLIDDPPSKQHIRQVMWSLEERGVRVAVFGFDPLQLNEALSDDEFEELVEEFAAHVLPLKTCYRQKEAVGKATKHAADQIAASTPFLHKPKIEAYREKYAFLTNLANDLQFKNPAGYTQVYENAIMENLIDEINRISRQPGLLWKHWHPLLVVVEKNGVLRDEVYDQLHQLDFFQVTLHNLEAIKGMEFQHVFLCLGRELFDRVNNGFQGTGQRVYNEMRLLRIPFSRAKDSLVTFVLDKPDES